jgi:hypothetical protein
MRRDGHRRARRASSATFSGVSRVASLRSRRRSRQSSTGRNANSRFDNLAASTTLSSSRREQKPTLPSPRRNYRCGCVRSGVVASPPTRPTSDTSNRWSAPRNASCAPVELGDPDVVLADAGYWHQRQIEAVASDGIEVLVAPDPSLRRRARPGWTGDLYDSMRRVLTTSEGRALYRQRQTTIARVFGQIKFNRAIRRFQRRDRSALQKRMASHRRDAQPPQAAPPRARRRPRLRRRRCPAAHAEPEVHRARLGRRGPSPDSLRRERNWRRRSREHRFVQHRRPAATAARAWSGRPARTC